MDIGHLLSEEGVRRCRIGKWMQDLPADDADTLNQAFSGDYPHTTLARVLQRLGLDVNPKQIQRHRSFLSDGIDRCSCKNAKAEAE